MELQKMFVTLAMNSANFKAGIADAQKAAEGFQGKVSGVFSKLGTIAKGAMLGIGVAVAAGFGMAIKSSIEVNQQLETTELQFETLMGSAEEARKHVEGLFKFAEKTPFETGPIIDASLKLQTFGGAALNTMENITLLGDAAAATNAPIDELGFWVGRLYANLQAGQPFGEAAMRLQELAVLSPQARKAMEDLQKSGASAAEVFAYFQKDLERFTGAMDKQASTWSGMTSTIKDQIQLLIADALRPLFDTAKEGMAGFIEALNDPAVSQAIDGISQDLEDLLETSIEVFGTLGKGLSNFGLERSLINDMEKIGLTDYMEAQIALADMVEDKRKELGFGFWESLFPENKLEIIKAVTEDFTALNGKILEFINLTEGSRSEWDDWGADEAARQTREFNQALDEQLSSWGPVIQASQEAHVYTTEYATDLTIWSDNAGVAYHQAMQFGAALGYNADEANRAAEALAAYNAAFIQEVPDYTTPIAETDEPLVSPERTVSFTTGGLSREQITLAEEYTDRINKLNTEIYNLNNGLGTYGMSQDQINEKVAAAQGEVAHYQALLAPLVAQTGEVSTAQQGMAVNVDATRQAIFDQLVQAGAAPEVIGAYGVAIGVMSMDQAEAALTAAAVRVKIEELAKQIAAGMPVDQALADLDEFIVKVEGGMVPSVETAKVEMLDQMGTLAFEMGFKAKEAGQNAMLGLQEGIDKEKAKAAAAAEQAAQDVIDGTNGAFQIQSPSRVFWNIGGNLMEGLRQGMQAAVGAVISAVTSIGTSVVQGLVNGINAAKGLVQAAIQSIADAIPDWLRQFLDSRSPSRRMIPLGEDIVAGIIVGIQNKDLDLYETLKEMFDIAGKFGNLASGFGQAFGRQVIDPIAESIADMEDQMAAMQDQYEVAGTVAETFGNRAAELLAELGLEGLDNPTMWYNLQRFQQSSNEEQRTKAIAAYNMLIAQANALGEQNVLQHQATLLNEEIIAQQEEMAKQQERLAAIEQKRADIAFLQQQFDLLQLIKDNKLDANLLDGITLGLEADAGALMDAMVAAMQQMIQAAEDELGIASPSKWARGLMENVFDTMADTAAYESRLLETGMEYALSPSLDIWDVPRGGSSADNRRINYGGYHVHVNTTEEEPLEYLWEISR